MECFSSQGINPSPKMELNGQIRGCWALVQQFSHPAEGPAVDLTGAISLQSLAMIPGWVAPMPIKPINGKSAMGRSHKPIAGHFGNNRSSGNGSALRLPLDQRKLTDSKWHFECAVNQEKIGTA
jgi:hypothetical protein